MKFLAIMGAVAGLLAYIGFILWASDGVTNYVYANTGSFDFSGLCGFATLVLLFIAPFAAAIQWLGDDE